MKIARKIKRIIKTLLGKDFFISPQIKFDSVRHGTNYGGWDVVEDNLNSTSVVYSFGVGEDASFDLSLINKFKLTVHAFDPTPKSVEWVRNTITTSNFVFHEYGIADFDGEIRFNPPKNINHVSHSILTSHGMSSRSILVPVKKITTILSELCNDSVDIFKMDIEGAEYQVINDILKSNFRPKQLLVEFHHRFPSVGIKKTKQAIRQLNDAGYLIYSVSDTGEEFSFIHTAQ